jgi:hypothetical protein
MNAELNIEFEGTIRLLGDMLTQLEIIHRERIVHGDLHPGHVMLSSEGAKIIGFGKAMYFDSEERLTSDVVKPKYMCMQSVFEIGGLRPSFRDDVYRAILIAGFVGQWSHTTRAYLDFCEGLISPEEDVIAWKKTGFIFECPDNCMVLEDLMPGNINQEQKFLIRSILESMVDSVRSIGPGDEMPPYELFFEQLNLIIDLLM